MINLSRQQLIVLGIVILIVIILLSVGISVAYLAPTPTPTHTQWKGTEQVVVPAVREPLTNAAPALAVYDNKLYLVDKGHSVDTIWWSWYVRR
jgi:hypothetical protein